LCKSTYFYVKNAFLYVSKGFDFILCVSTFSRFIANFLDNCPIFTDDETFLKE